MGIDLALLVLDCDQETMSYAHTNLRVAQSYSLSNEGVHNQ